MDFVVVDFVFCILVKMVIYDWEKGEIWVEMSFLDFIKYYFFLLNVGFLVMDLSIGLVKVWVGGMNYKYFKYDYVKVKW